MIPWRSLDAERTPDGNLLELFARGEEMVIRIDGEDLMGSRRSGSEEALATRAVSASESKGPRRYLIGGLGMGFTARALLDRMAPDDSAVVAEISPAVARWNREHLGHLADHPLDDPRLELFMGDVAEAMARNPRSFAGIMLDVDNGPAEMTAGNRRIYTTDGIRLAGRSLADGGALAYWSASPDDGFRRRLDGMGLAVQEKRARARGKKGPVNTIYLVTLPSPLAAKRD